MSDSNNTQSAFENALKLLKDNNLNEAIEQLNEILKGSINEEKLIHFFGKLLQL